MGGGASGTQRTVSEPWAGQKPYIEDVFNKAQTQYNYGDVNPYQGDTTADMSGYTQAMVNNMANYGQSAPGYMQYAQGQLWNTARGDSLNNYRQYNPELTNTASGAYLNAGNPYLQNAIGSATRPLTENFNENVMPSIDARFALGGRYGSPGAHGHAANEAAKNYMNQVGDIASGMSYQNYGDERSRQEAASGQLAGLYGQERANQMQAIGMAPSLQASDVQRMGLVGQAGAISEGYQQADLDAARNLYYEWRDAPWEELSRYNNIISGAGSGGWSNTATSGGRGGSAAMGAAGGALSGAASGAMIGSMFGPGYGTAIGAGVGALAGGAGGYYGSR